jgi:membrane-associated phospholipid phosphatase
MSASTTAARAVQEARSDNDLELGVTRTWKTVVAGSLLFARAAMAQSDSSTQKTFFVGRDAAWAGAFLAASAGLSVFDARIAKYFQDTTKYHVREGRRLDGAFTHINETTLTVGGLALYGIGKLAHAETMADIAFHTAESVAAASLTAQVIRGPLGRTRPQNADKPYDNQYEFHFFQGFTHFEQRAFPSIHSSSGFAAASAIVAEVKHRDPGAVWYVGVPAYLLAMTPGLSRMYLGQHWASDVFSGAFLGTFYGWRIVNYSHSHPTTPVDRVFLGTVKNTQMNFGPHNASLGWNITF